MAKAIRGSWGTRFGFLIAAVGSAVGLGNIWKFPYITGVYGGGAFVLAYLGCIVLVGLPILMAELTIGAKSKKNPVGAFIALDTKRGKKSPWQLAGWFGVLAGFFIMSFYSVTAGWSMAYVLKAIQGFSGTAAEIKAEFEYIQNTPSVSILWHTLFMGLSIAIVIRGVQKGIEKWSKILMPTLGVILAGLCIYGAFFTSGGSKALTFLFKPDFSKLTSEGILSAMGHSFFTLSLGMGTMITYGSYLKKEVNYFRTSLTIAFFDTAIALAAGLAIFSLVFTHGLEASSGPGLIFTTLPVLFKETGILVALPFFLLLTFAALTSAISILEVVVAYFIDEKGWSRTKSTLGLGGLIYLAGILCTINDFTFQFQGKERNFYDLFDFVTTNYMLPIGGLLVALFVGWVIKDKLPEDTSSGIMIHKIMRFILRYVTPVLVAVIILHGLNILWPTADIDVLEFGRTILRR